jgi:Flp pilus assembly protein TadD
MEEFEEAIRINPNHAEAHNDLGVTLYYKGLIDEAIK